MSHTSDKVRILKCQGYKVSVTVNEDPPKNRNDHSWGLESSQDSSLTFELLSEPRVCHGHTNNLIPSCHGGPQRKRVNTFLVPPANMGILRNHLGDYNSWQFSGLSLLMSICSVVRQCSGRKNGFLGTILSVMDREARRAVVHGVAKSQTRLSD